MHPAHGVTCPHLQDDKRCGVYAQRFAPGQPAIKAMSLYVLEDEVRTLYCGRIMELLERGLVDPRVEAGCCYAHPELLEQHEILSDPEE